MPVPEKGLKRQSSNDKYVLCPFEAIAKVQKEPEGLKLQQPWATPWVSYEQKMQPERLLENYDFLAAFQAALLLPIFPGRCPGLLQFGALRALIEVRQNLIFAEKVTFYGENSILEDYFSFAIASFGPFSCQCPKKDLKDRVVMISMSSVLLRQLQKSKKSPKGSNCNSPGKRPGFRMNKKCSLKGC